MRRLRQEHGAILLTFALIAALFIASFGLYFRLFSTEATVSKLQDQQLGVFRLDCQTIKASKLLTKDLSARDNKFFIERTQRFSARINQLEKTYTNDKNLDEVITGLTEYAKGAKVRNQALYKAYLAANKGTDATAIAKLNRTKEWKDLNKTLTDTRKELIKTEAKSKEDNVKQLAKVGSKNECTGMFK